MLAHGQRPRRQGPQGDDSPGAAVPCVRRDRGRGNDQDEAAAEDGMGGARAGEGDVGGWRWKRWKRQ